MERVRIIETSNLSDLEMVKLTLRRHGIEHLVLNGNTLTIGNTYAMGHGGAIVEIDKRDLEKAAEVLREGGLVEESDADRDRFGIVGVLEGWVERLVGLFKGR